MSAGRVRLSSQTRDGLTAVTFLAVVIVLGLAWLWLVPFEWTPPRVG